MCDRVRISQEMPTKYAIKKIILFSNDPTCFGVQPSSWIIWINTGRFNDNTTNTDKLLWIRYKILHTHTYTYYIYIYIYIHTHTHTGLFEMIVGVLTTCHTQYTWDRSICNFYLIEQHPKFLLRALQKTLRISWSIGAATYSYLKCTVHDKLLSSCTNGSRKSQFSVRYVKKTCSIKLKNTYKPISSVLYMTSC